MNQPSYAERRKLALREEIIAAAIDVFTESGYHDAGVADIAGRVGIGSSTFYRHFDSKRAILEEVVNTIIRRAADAFDELDSTLVLNTVQDYTQYIYQQGELLQEAFGNLRLMRLILIEAPNIDLEFNNRIASIFEVAIARSVKYIERGLQAGYLRADLDAIGTSRAAVGMIFGLTLLNANLNPDGNERSRTVRASVRMLLDGVLAESPPTTT